MTYSKMNPWTALRGLSLCLLSLVLMSSCQKDDDETITPITADVTVDTELQYYFDLFVEEGAKRGLSIDLSEVEGYIEEISEENVAGQCTYSSAHPNRVVIDQTYWERVSLAYREMVVFHELGHCSLLRGHRDDSSPNGVCQSIMNSGLSDCRLLYNNQNREAYLNELFGN